MLVKKLLNYIWANGGKRMSKKVEQDVWANRSSEMKQENGETMYRASRDYIGKLSFAEPSEFSTGVTIVVQNGKITRYMLYKTGMNGFIFQSDMRSEKFFKNLPTIVQHYIEDYSNEHEEQLKELLKATLEG